MYLAATLSRAFLPEVNACEFTRELEEVDHKAFPPASDSQWRQIMHASADDPVLQLLRTTIREGWPESRSDLPESLYPYYDMRELLTAQNELVFKGERLVVPASLCKELMAAVRSSHIGIEGCIRRARVTFYWPRKATKLREYISKCVICLSHRTEQTKEPLLQHDVIARPWSKVTADLYEPDNRTLLVIVDHYSNFVEVPRLRSVTSRSVIKEMKATFARYGIPDILIFDNGPQFASAEFAVFAKSWMFQHITSSPYQRESRKCSQYSEASLCQMP